MSELLYSKDEILTVSSRKQIFDIQFYKDTAYLHTIENFVNFIKACEKLIRGSHEYETYKGQLYGMGLTHCQILGHINNDLDDSVEIEMHHGPILTLFDYCAIVTDYLLLHKEKINTFIIAKKVLDEHFEGNVQTIMLSKTVHQLVDSGEIFINFNQAIGNLNNFLTKYRDGLNEERVNKINRYIELSEEFDSYDNGLLDLKNTITDWNYELAKQRTTDLNIKQTKKTI